MEVRTMRLTRIMLTVVAAALLVTASACGDDDDNGGGAQPTVASTRASASPTRAAANTPSGGTESETLNVAAQDFSFSPGELEATRGKPYTIALDNRGQFPHTLTVYEDEDFTRKVAQADTGRVAGGASGQFVVTFNEAKDYYFRCEVHPTQMQGEIKVQ
jgi:plastocyanin